MSTPAAPPSPPSLSTWRVTTPSTGWVRSSTTSCLGLRVWTLIRNTTNLTLTFCLSANKEEVFQVAIPRFHMVCPPYREPVGRTVDTQLNLLSLQSCSRSPRFNREQTEAGSLQEFRIWPQPYFLRPLFHLSFPICIWVNAGHVLTPKSEKNSDNSLHLSLERACFGGLLANWCTTCPLSFPFRRSKGN